MRRALAASAAAHLLLVLAAVMAPRVAALEAPPPETTAEMVFVNPGDGQTGAKPAPPAPPPAPAVSPSDTAGPPAQLSPPLPAAPTEEANAEPIPAAAQPPLPVAARTPPPKPAAAPAEAPEVRLGDSDAGGTTDDVRGDDVPVGPDPTAPNIPPRYPPDAVRHGEQGVVVLEVAVSPDGGATGVGVYLSSGSAVLDRAARDAVARWRFKPKLDAGQPIPAHTLIRVRFRLD